VVGPIARLELIPAGDTKPAGDNEKDSIIEAQIPAQQSGIWDSVRARRWW
jgi:sulfate transport system ATP-binding protein